jgi:hypothetical protein
METKSVSLPPDIAAALIGECPPGETCTVTLKVGEPGEDGSVSVEVQGETDSVAPEGAPEGAGIEDIAGGESPEAPLEPTSSEPDLGYDRGALLSAREKSRKARPMPRMGDMMEG